MVLALSGRRIDAANATAARFPLANVELVRQRIQSLFKAQAVRALVSSAACGADLIALSEAGRLGLANRIILPSGRDQFKQTSVSDRPGGWDTIYDNVIDAASANGSLILLNDGSSQPPYFSTSRVILDEAAALAANLGISAGAALIWDGVSRGRHDVTEDFAKEARKRGLRVLEVSTL